MDTQKNINPLLLVREIAKPRLIVSLLIAFAFHILLLGATSIPFIGDCIEYKTLHPKTVKKALEKQEAERIKAEQKRIAEEKGAQEQAKREAEQKEMKEKTSQIIAQDKMLKDDLERKKKEEEERKKREAAGDAMSGDAAAPAAPQKPANLGNEKASDSAIEFAD